jgi:hypothetical protein
VPSGDPLNLSTPSTRGCNPVRTITGSTTLTAGCYDGLNVTGSGVTLTFASNGQFEFTGPINVSGPNATLRGTGITLYLANSSALINFTNSRLPTLQLYAPTSGTWNGILIDQSSSDTSTLQITGANGSTLEGIFYVPNATVDLTNAANLNLYAAFVAKQLTYTGSGTLTIQDYLTKNTSSPLATITLVE